MESSERIAPPLSSSSSRSLLNRGSEASIASLGSSSGSRSGIKMGLTSQRLAISRPVRPLDPNELLLNHPHPPTFDTSSKGEDNATISAMLQRMRIETSDPEEEYIEEEESEESEWEQEITSDGNVQYVLPFAAEETEDRFRRSQEIAAAAAATGNSSNSSLSHPPPEAGVKESGKRLSRLVRRRESKRDRTSGGQVVLKTPGGISNPASTSKLKNVNSHESSDNDSSTYGQIKTFEAFFEASNLDCSVASPAPAASTLQRPPVPPEISTHPDEKSQEDMTEIHQVVLKFQAKPFRSQIPRFQMLLHGDNPVNRGMLLENLLGIVPEPKPIQSQVSSSGIMQMPTVIDNSVVIGNLVPQGPAMQAGDKIRVGDIIRSLDGHHVTLDSVNTFLLSKLTRIQSSSSSSVKVKLILQRPMKVSFHSKVHMPAPLLTHIDMSSQRKAVWEQHRYLSHQALSVLESSAICAAIVTQNSTSESATSMDLSNVLYQFPRGSSSGIESSLLKVSGIFSTLIQLLPDIVASEPQGLSLLVPSKDHDPQWMHVALQIDGDEILVLGLSATRISSERVHGLAQQLTRFLLLKYSSLMTAALSASTKDLDQLFGNLLYETLFDKMTAIKLDSVLSEVPCLLLPPDVHFQVEDALNQFESADFQDFSDHFYDLPREFTIFGCSVFYRGFLVSSHLPRHDLLDLRLWLKHNRLITLTKSNPVHKVVVWQEMFPSSSKSLGRRRFLLVAGLGYQLIGVILETGGCTAAPGGSVTPDPFYVDQALFTLEHLSEMGIDLVCEKWLTLPQNPSLIDIDNVITSMTSKSSSKSAKKSTAEKESIDKASGIVLKRTKSLDIYESSPSPSPDPIPSQERLSDSYEMSTAFRGVEDKDEEVSSVWELPRGGIAGRPRSNRQYQDFGTFLSMRSSLSAPSAASSSNLSLDSEVETSTEDLITYNVSRLTISQDCSLIHFLHLNTGDGLFLAPKTLKAGDFQMQSILLENFRAAVEMMHAILQQVKPSIVGGFKEQGMLFHWTVSENLPVFSYWVCGRLTSTPEVKESYVAYHESASQQMVELAYRLAFGVHA